MEHLHGCVEGDKGHCQMIDPNPSLLFATRADCLQVSGTG